MIPVKPSKVAMNSPSIFNQIEAQIKNTGFDHYGLAPIPEPFSMDIYKDWLKNEYHGSMTFLEKHSAKKESAKLLAPFAKTLISIAAPYVPWPKNTGESQGNHFPGLKVARYAAGNDYHHWFKNSLESICTELSKTFPEARFYTATDSLPILERDLASQLGLGWIGKNSCLIHPKKGSFFLLGEILTDLDIASGKNLEARTPLPDMCGTCTRCIEACPTDAILNNRTLDAKKCISYWTIEAKTNPPENLRHHFKGWFFGCDICQSVCPWNQKLHGKEMVTDDLSTDGLSKQQTIESLKTILGSSNKALQKKLKFSPLRRAGGNGLKRSALRLIGELKLIELKDFLTPLDFENETLNEIKIWALNHLEK